MAQARLTGFLGEGIDASRLLALDRSDAPPPVPGLDALVAQAETSRGELAAFQHEVEAARFSASAADRRRFPEPEVVRRHQVVHRGTGGSGGAVTVGSGAVGPLVGVQMTIPLFDRAKPERALADARAARPRLARPALRSVLRSEAAALREAVIQRRAAAERYRAEGLGSAVRDRAHRAGQLRGRRARHPRVAGCLPPRCRPRACARPALDLAVRAGRDRAGVRDRLGDAAMRMHSADRARRGRAQLSHACNRGQRPGRHRPSDELPALDVTHWTETTELFMEYPPLVAGQPALFAMHLTKLADFTPVSRGSGHGRVHARVGRRAEDVDRAAARRGPGRFASRRRRRRRAVSLGARARSAGPVRSSRPGDASRCSPTSSAARADADEAAGRRSRGHRLPEGTAVDQPVRHGARGRRPTCGRRCARPATVHPLPGGEAIVAAPAAGRFSADDAAVDRRSRARRAGAGAPGAAARRGRRSGHAGGRGRRGARRRGGRAGRAGAGRTAAGGAGRAGAARRGRAPRGRRSPRRACGPRRPGSRSGTKRCARAAAPRPAMRSRCARRSPAGWPT